MKKLNNTKFKAGDILMDEYCDVVEVVYVQVNETWRYVTRRLSDEFLDCKKEKHLSEIDKD